MVEDTSEGPVQEREDGAVLQIGGAGGRDRSSKGRYGERRAGLTDSLLLGGEIYEGSGVKCKGKLH